MYRDGTYKVEIFSRCTLGGGTCAFTNIKHGKNTSRIGTRILEKKRNERWRILYGRSRLTVTLVVSGRFSEDCPKYKARCLIWECFVYRWYNVGKNHLHQKNEIWHTCMWSLFFSEHFKFCLIYIMVPCIIILMLH